jgi:preprotein translocase subunit SecE
MSESRNTITLIVIGVVIVFSLFYSLVKGRVNSHSKRGKKK